MKRYVAFQEDLTFLGFHHARKKHNKHRNFDRNFKKLLVPLKINNGKAKLTNVLAKRLKEWKVHWMG
jgi:hypothetical protein